MKHLLFLSAFIFFALSLQAQNLEGKSNADLLKELDEIIAQKLEYRSVYIEKIDSLKRCASRQSMKVRGETYHKIFHSYVNLQTDSAMAYLNKMESLPQMDDDLEYAFKTKLCRAQILGVMGLYSSAVHTLEEVKSEGRSPELLLNYYQVCRSVYGWMVDFGEIADQQGHYLDLTQQYRDSIISVQQPSINRSIVEADRFIVLGELAKAKSISESCLAKADALQSCYLDIILADIAKAEGSHKDEIRYLTQAAIGDLKRGVTEYSALGRLAVLLSEEGDTERAYEYLICAMEDAVYCKARLRSLEASTVFPIIERAHQAKMKERTRRNIVFYCIIGLFILLLSGLIIYLKKRNKQLAETRQMLAKSIEDQKVVNETLRHVNNQLLHSDKAKETYVARYLERCRGYIGTMEERRKHFLRLLKNRQYEELQNALKSDTQITEEEQSFYADFDDAFLTLYPNFITHFNALLQPDAQIILKHDELLNTELRIFALIRLGITDSTRIAHFLNYSLPTIYSYRSRLRNKSIYSKEEFDVKIMEC